MEEKEAQGQEDVEAGTPQPAPAEDKPATNEPAPAEPSGDESDPGIPIEPGK